MAIYYWCPTASQVRWILNFVNQSTHENPQKNWYPTKKSDFTVSEHFVWKQIEQESPNQSRSLFCVKDHCVKILDGSFKHKTWVIVRKKVKHQSINQSLCVQTENDKITAHQYHIIRPQIIGAKKINLSFSQDNVISRECNVVVIIIW